MDPDSSHPRPQPPTPLLVAAAVVVVEGLVSFGFGIAEALHTTGERIALGVTTSLFFVAYGAGMVLCAWGLTRLQTWARGPVLLAQLIALGLAWNFRDAETLLVTVGFAVPAVVVLVGMLHPQTLEALEGPAPVDED